MMKKAKLLWVDLEMTGLDPEKDKILEVAAIATDWQFNIIDKMTAVVKVPEQLIKERMVGEFWEAHKETRDALVLKIRFWSLSKRTSGKRFILLVIQFIRIRDLLLKSGQNWTRDCIIGCLMFRPGKFTLRMY